MANHSAQSIHDSAFIKLIPSSGGINGIIPSNAMKEPILDWLGIHERRDRY